MRCLHRLAIAPRTRPSKVASSSVQNGVNGRSPHRVFGNPHHG
jgi:hypothetical protein